MRAKEKKEMSYGHLLIIALAILFGFIGLVSLDKDTHSIADIFSVRVVPALFLYGLPAVILCSLFFEYLLRDGISVIKGMTWTIFALIPLSFALTAGVLILIKTVIH